MLYDLLMYAVLVESRWRWHKNVISLVVVDNNSKLLTGFETCLHEKQL